MKRRLPDASTARRNRTMRGRSLLHAHPAVAALVDGLRQQLGQRSIKHRMPEFKAAGHHLRS